MKNYKVNICSFFLDFSFPGFVTLENRIFLTLPISESKDDYNKEKVDYLSICFEMNSVFNKNYEEENSIGFIKLFLVKDEIKKTEQDFKDYFSTKNKDAAITSDKIYVNEQEMYANIINDFDSQLNIIPVQWIEYVKSKKVQNLKKDKNYIENLEEEEKKIKIFIAGTKNILKEIFILDKSKNKNIQDIMSNEEILLIRKKFNYMHLNEELNVEKKNEKYKYKI